MRIGIKIFRSCILFEAQKRPGIYFWDLKTPPNAVCFQHTAKEWASCGPKNAGRSSAKGLPLVAIAND